MQKGIVGKKLGMTQLFDANGNVVPVTVIEAGPVLFHRRRQSRTTVTKQYRSAMAILRLQRLTNL